MVFLYWVQSTLDLLWDLHTVSMGLGVRVLGTINSWLVLGLALCIRETCGKGTLCTYWSLRVPTSSSLQSFLYRMDLNGNKSISVVSGIIPQPVEFSTIVSGFWAPSHHLMMDFWRWQIPLWDASVILLYRPRMLMSFMIGGLDSKIIVLSKPMTPIESSLSSATICSGLMGQIQVIQPWRGITHYIYLYIWKK